ncbi:hypothetical protein PC118_g9026 [Phytophthora cactorum]|uniref:Transmembrane protein n=1 Tax=Phytophthora cactorum TaxID=29920 RepID=A0A8T0Z700_9STRA|nr:hypothetical protein PC111_g8886 [Phytophthora cactorum]KAG2857939.1 hypothetical protein PC113_g10237 [Phytophthora cactorum]KAG2920093.1 hypothetical protein PC115_g9917 [Phytophthora cactorum]KAG2984140.1 hypothetical protein PC118_g9026 [Phytophthora cactorum]KAG3016817.1 hypothetical protein PC119_g11218 [Phytophthora cactorum]
MFDSTQHLQALLSASSPTPHAIRGVSAALAALTAIANLTNNRKAILSLLRLRLSPRFELATPSRNSFALALFIGIFRYLQRSASLQIKCKLGKMVPNPTRNVALPTGVVPAAAVAAGICTLWMAPTSRPAVLSLLSTNAALTLFKDFLAKYSDLNFLKPLELLVFMAAGGWIFSAGFFNPESYERSHMKQILKSVVLKQNVAIQLQEIALDNVDLGPASSKNPPETSSDPSTRISEEADALVCILNWLQFFLSGAIPSLAIFAESPGRRRSIGLILISYALVSAGNVATRKVLLLQPGVSSVRGLLEAGCVAAAVSVILPGLLEDNHLIRRMLLGDVEARAFQDVLKQAKADSACDTKPVAVL